MTRHLVICADGTWNRPDQEDRGRIVPSNVVKVCRGLANQTSERIQQLTYYDTGVGTGGRWDRIKGGVFGVGLSENVKQAYEWLGRNLNPGSDQQSSDKIFIFGFSRGAFTARSLAGLIGKCGIPDASNGNLANIVETAYRIYRMAPGQAANDAARDHAKQYSHSRNGSEIVNEVWFVGVWDTVGALGVPLKLLNSIGRSKHRFHDVTLGAHIKHAYHAVAIDERRKPFKPTLWLNINLQANQKVEQVWFPGVHSNIGGGYVDSGLSDRAFLWMCLKARDAGLAFNPPFMSRRVDPNYHGELRDSMTAVYKALGPETRNIGETVTVGIGGSQPAFAGEFIHYSAKERFDHPTEELYRQSVANNLGIALEPNAVSIAPASEDEKKFHAGKQIDWG